MIATHPVLMTALEYIRESVKEGKFDSMKDLIEVAREYGASQSRIDQALVLGLREQN